MAEGRDIPEPAREHQLLRAHVGRWRVDCTYFLNPAHPPVKTTAIETIEMLGDFWCRSHFVGQMDDFVLEGSATMGYEPHRGKWVSTWIDNGSPVLFTFEGELDEETGTLEMTGTGPNPMTGEATTFRSVETVLDPEQRRFDMYITLETGDEMQMFSYVYTREE
jgi:hypothetical protein